MADTLKLIIDIDGKRGEKALSGVIAQMNGADKATKQLQKDIGATPKYIEDLSRSMQNGMKSTEKAMNSVAKAAQNIRTGTAQAAAGVTTLGSRGISTMSSMGAGVSKVTGLVKSLTTGILAVTAAIGGISFAKVAGDYLAFSKQVGQANAIIAGNGATSRTIEQSAIKGMVGTGQSGEDIMGATRYFMSSSAFDPTKKGQFKMGSPEYIKELEKTGEMMKTIGEMSTVTDTPIRDMTAFLTTWANIYGKDITDRAQLNEGLDTATALLNSSIGDMAQLVPELSKFGQEFKLKGVGSDEALSIFSTMTQVFGESEAGTRSAAVARWSTNSVRDIERLKKEMSPDIARQYEAALYSKDPTTGLNKARPVREQLEGVMNLMKSFKDAKDTDLFGSIVMAEVRESSGIRTITNLKGILDNTLQNFGTKTGVHVATMQAYWETTGAKMDNLFKSMQASAFVTGGALIDAFFGGGMDPTEFAKTMDVVIEDSRKKLGEGGANFFKGIKDGVMWLSKPEGKAFVESLQKGAENLAVFATTFGKGLLDAFNSEPVQALLKFAAANPVLTIGALTFGPSVAGSIATMLASAFGMSIVGASLKSSIIAALTGGGIAGATGGTVAGAAGTASGVGAGLVAGAAKGALGAGALAYGTAVLQQNIWGETQKKAEKEIYNRMKAINPDMDASTALKYAQRVISEAPATNKELMNSSAAKIPSPSVGVMYERAYGERALPKLLADIERVMNKPVPNNVRPNSFISPMQPPKTTKDIAGGVMSNVGEFLSRFSSVMTPAGDQLKASGEKIDSAANNFNSVLSNFAGAISELRAAAEKVGNIQVNVNGGGSGGGGPSSTPVRSSSADKGLFNFGFFSI